MRPQIDKESLARQFSENAVGYEKITPVQQAMSKELVQLVMESLEGQDVRHVLELGCGTGRLTRRLVRTFPEAQITAIDFCPGMLAQAAYKLSAAAKDRVELFVADAELFVQQEKARFDLIIANAVVQWFNQLRETLSAYHQLLKPGGLLALATFGPETFHELNLAFQLADVDLGKAQASRVLPLLSAASYKEIFPGASITEGTRKQKYPDVRSFLRTIQQAGAAYSPPETQPLTRQIYAKMEEHYNRLFADPEAGHITATYHLIYLLASSL